MLKNNSAVACAHKLCQMVSHFKPHIFKKLNKSIQLQIYFQYKINLNKKMVALENDWSTKNLQHLFLLYMLQEK